MGNINMRNFLSSPTNIHPVYVFAGDICLYNFERIVADFNARRA